MITLNDYKEKYNKLKVKKNLNGKEALEAVKDEKIKEMDAIKIIKRLYKGKREKIYFCDLTEKEGERLSMKRAKKLFTCSNAMCFACYGDGNY